MLQNKAEVHIYRNRDGEAPDQIVEFAFVAGAREYARNLIIEGKAKKAIVKDRDGKVIETFPS